MYVFAEGRRLSVRLKEKSALGALLAVKRDAASSFGKVNGDRMTILCSSRQVGIMKIVEALHA